MWDLVSGPGIEPMSSVLEDKLLTTGPEASISYSKSKTFSWMHFMFIYWGTSYSIAFFKPGSILWTPLKTIKNRKICVQKRELWRTEQNNLKSFADLFLIFSSSDTHYILTPETYFPQNFQA